MIRVLVVEDSPTIRQFLVHVLGSEPGLQVVGTAGNGDEALAAVARLEPDVITMDIVMPKVDGLEATRRIMETRPTPIVIVSAHLPAAEARASFRALEAGALAVVPRPEALSSPDHSRTARELVRTVRLMSEVKVVRRRSRRLLPTVPAPSAPVDPKVAHNLQLIAIGGSTGAPGALQTILSRLPSAFPFPLVVVQHIAPGFIEGFAEWLAGTTPLQVRVARDGELLRPGSVYLAPDRLHMAVASPGQIRLQDAPPEHGLRPSVGFLCRSLAVSFGARAAGVLLSGMGADGAAALKEWRDRGALTIVQDQASSVVHGMPGEAVQLGAAGLVLAPEAIAATLLSLAGCEAAPPPQARL